MGKRAERDHDATMDLSMSQLVVSKPPAAPGARPRLPGVKNDASMWAYRVVGTDDFAPAPVKRQRKRGRWIAAGVLGAAAAAGGSYALLTNSSDDAPAQEAAAAPVDKPAPPAPPPAKVATRQPDPKAKKPTKVADAAPAKPVADPAAAKAIASDPPDAITSADQPVATHKAAKRAVKKTAGLKRCLRLLISSSR